MGRRTWCIPAGTYELLEELRPEIPWRRAGWPGRTLVEMAVLTRDFGLGMQPGPTDVRCGICGERPDGLEYHFDHIVPIARGGAHHIGNLQFAHAACNLQKGAGS